MATPVKVEGTTYPTITAAAKALGITRQAVSARIDAGKAEALAEDDPGAHRRKSASERGRSADGFVRAFAKVRVGEGADLESYHRRWQRETRTRISREKLYGLLLVEGLSARKEAERKAGGGAS
jgi:hypothetical protein